MMENKKIGSVSELAARFNLSKRRIYEIIDEQNIAPIAQDVVTGSGRKPNIYDFSQVADEFLRTIAKNELMCAKINTPKGELTLPEDPETALPVLFKAFGELCLYVKEQQKTVEKLEIKLKNTQQVQINETERVFDAIQESNDIQAEDFESLKRTLSALSNRILELETKKRKPTTRKSVDYNAFMDAWEKS